MKKIDTKEMLSSIVRYLELACTNYNSSRKRATFECFYNIKTQKINTHRKDAPGNNTSPKVEWNMIIILALMGTVPKWKPWQNHIRQVRPLLNELELLKGRVNKNFGNDELSCNPTNAVTGRKIEWSDGRISYEAQLTIACGQQPVLPVIPELKASDIVKSYHREHFEGLTTRLL